MKIKKTLKKGGTFLSVQLCVVSMILNMAYPVLYAYALDEVSNVDEPAVEEVIEDEGEADEEEPAEEPASEEAEGEEEAPVEEVADLNEEVGSENEPAENAGEEEVLIGENGETPAVEDPVLEEPAVKNPVTEDPVADDPSSQETSEEPASEEPATEEQPAEESQEPEEQVWRENEDGSMTTTVVEGEEYEYLDSGFKIKFTRIDSGSGEITIKEIKLTSEQVEELNALSDTAWDVTSNMENGTFEYKLTLPIEEKVSADEVKVVYAEEKEDLDDEKKIKEVDDEDVKVDNEKKEIVAEDLDHFTVFILVSPDESLNTSNNGVTNEDNAWVSDDLRVTFNNDDDYAVYGFPDLAIPSGSSISGIEVLVEGYASSSRDFEISLWNISDSSPDSYTSAKEANVGSSETTITVGGPTEKWGKNWEISDFSDADFKVRVDADNDSGNAYLDYLGVKVYYQPPLYYDSGNDYALTAVSGIWTDVDGGSNINGLNTEEVRWGNSAGYGQSGLRFDGSGLQSFDEGDDFYLGALTHFNWPIYNAADGATLRITLQFEKPEISPDPQFTFDFNIEETSNTAGSCPSWQESNTPCDDKITFPSIYGEESFEIGDKLYTLEILGFVDSYPDGSPVSEFITEEQKNNTAFLVGRLSSVLVAQPAISIKKKTNNIDVTEVPGPNLNAGDAVNWQYIVQNTGNVELTGISVTDNPSTSISCPKTSLAPGEDMTCNASGTVIVGQFTNTATVSGSYDGGSVNDSDTSWYYGVLQKATLILEKIVTNNNGGQKKYFDFNVYINGAASSWGSHEVDAGTYVVSEDNLSGYSAGTWGGDCDASGNVTLAPGDNKTCTITNDDQPGKLIVKKVIASGDASFEDFSFTINDGSSIAFESDGENEIELNAGTYNVSENTNFAYSASHDNCSGIELANGETEICTITNTRDTGQLKAIKTIDDGTALNQWSFSLDNSSWVSADASGEVDFGQVPTLTDFTIYEQGPAGYHLNSVSCTYAYTDNQNGSVTTQVAKGGTTVCTFNNNVDRGSITITKEADPKDGQDFSFATTGSGLSNFSLDDDADATLNNTEIFSNLFPGEFTITENELAGWDLTNLSCVESGGQSAQNSSTDKDNRKVTLQLEAGENISCIFTNTKRGHIIIQKNAINDSDQEFTFNNNFGNGNPASFVLVDDSTVGLPSYNAEVLPGEYTVSEDPVAGWQQESATCDQGETIESINVEAGETVTCTFTNEEYASITLVKKTVGGDGAFNFSATGDGLPASIDLTTVAGTASQTFNDLDQDNTYSLAENVPAGWDLTSASCDNDDPIDAITPNAGEQITCTFANTKFATISGMKIHDKNADGIRGAIASEPSLSGWTIYLFDSLEPGSEPIDSYETKGHAGEMYPSYRFENLIPGTYYVCEELKNDWFQSYPNSGLTYQGNYCHEVNASEGKYYGGFDFLNYTYGTIKVKKINDLNGNGNWDSGEPYLADWKFFVDTNGNKLLDADEPFAITETQSPVPWPEAKILVKPGQYTVCEVLQGGWTQTFPAGNACVTAPPVNSDAVVLASSFLNYQYGSISGYKFNDLNGDGIWDQNETALEGWTIFIDANNNGQLDAGEKSTTTDIDGKYEFNELNYGNYRVREQGQAGWSQTTANPADITIQSGSDVKDVNFGNQQMGKIIVKKETLPDSSAESFEFDPSWSDTNFNLSDGQQEPSDWLVAGTYSVSETVPTGWDLTNATCSDGSDPSNINLDPNETVTCTFTNTKLPTLTVNKILLPNDDSGLFNLRIDGVTVGTGANVGNGGTTGAITVGVGQHTVSETAGTDTSLENYIPPQISGDCTNYHGEFIIDLAPGENKTCTITNTKKAKIVVEKQTLPDGSSQSFEFRTNYTPGGTFNLSDGQTNDGRLIEPNQFWYVQENTPADWDLTSATCTGGNTPDYIFPDPGEIVTCTFVNTQKGKIIVEKQVLPDGHAQTFNFSGEVSGTIGDGGQLDKMVEPGTYTVSETPSATSGFHLTGIVCDDGNSSGDVQSGTATFNIEAGETVKCTFTNEIFGSVTAHKFHDENMNGTQDNEEADLSDWGMTLYLGSDCQEGNSRGTDITDSNGNVTFYSIVPGDQYSIKETLKDNWANVSAVCQNFTITPNESKLIEFGNVELGSIAAHKFLDDNINGTQEPGEADKEGWQMTLYEGQDCSFGGIQKDQKNTDVNGDALFGSLMPGNYSVQEYTTSGGWTNSTNTCQNITLGAGQNLTVDFGNFEYAKIKGHKFNDANNSGGYDNGESYLDGWQMNLYDENWTNLGNNFTSLANSGYYQFDGKPTGTYIVCERLDNQTDWVQTYPNVSTQGAVANQSSNGANEGEYCWQVVIDQSGQVFDTLDFGNIQYGSIIGTKYNDLNGSGDRDTIEGTSDTEPGLPGWTITLFDSNENQIGQTTTDERGDYWFDDLVAGTYGVCEVHQPGWLMTEPNFGGGCRDVVVVAGQQTWANFGNRQNPVMIDAKKVVCEDEKYLPNWGGGGHAIDATTAEDYVNTINAQAGDEVCYLEQQWQFQWGPAGAGSNGAFQKDTSSLSDPWTTFTPVLAGNPAVIYDLSRVGSRIEVREVFSYGPMVGFSNDSANNFSSEFYCTGDAANYDNWEWINNPQYGTTYYCVGFNALADPEISIDKTGPEFVEKDEPVTYNYAVTNAGNVPLSNVSVSDDKCSPVEYQNGDANGDNKLDLDETWNYSCTTTPTWIFNTQLENTATAEGYFEEIKVDASDKFKLYSFILRKDVKISENEKFSDPNALFDVEVKNEGNVIGNVQISEAAPAKMWVAEGSYQFCEVNVSDKYTPHYPGGCLTFNTGTCPDWTHINYIKPVTISATKIVCQSEDDLPNWGAKKSLGNPITENTAIDYVNNSGGRCWLEEGWEFEYGPKNSGYAGDDYVGYAGGNYISTGYTDGNGNVQVKINDLTPYDGRIEVREVLKDGYLPFTYAKEGNRNTNNVTAEIYCANDVMNYDNWEWINNPEYDQTYHCVAWNVELYDIHGYKWYDENGNGEYDCESPCEVCFRGEGDERCEEKLAGWEIFIDENGNQQWDEGEKKTTTSNDPEHYGRYWFEDLMPGTYSVCEVGQDKWTQTCPVSICHEITLPDKNVNGLPVSENYVSEAPEYNFGNMLRAEVTVYKFEDKNGNGVFDESESLLPDWEMNMSETEGEYDETQTTDENGETVFDLNPGEYELTENLKEGWVQTGMYCDSQGEGILITEPGEAYGHHGNCSGWNKCGNAETCALKACQAHGYSNLVSYGDERPCTQFNNCSLFYDIDVDLSYEADWGNWCDVMGVTDIVCSNGPLSNGVGVGVMIEQEEQESLDGTLDVKVRSGENTSCYVGNYQYGKVTVTKYDDVNGNGERDEGERVLPDWDINLNQTSEGPSATVKTDENGQAVFGGLLFGEYELSENLKTGWQQTNISCGEVGEMQEIDNDNSYPIEISSGSDVVCEIGNQLLLSELYLSKSNNEWSNGPDKIGSLITYTIKVRARINGVNNVVVTDLPPNNFAYVPGSWTASSNKRGDLKALGITGEPTYHSPGDWQLGDMEEGEEVTLTYVATIEDPTTPGIYPDLAWAKGTSLYGEEMIALSEGSDFEIENGIVDGNFVGTQIEVESDDEPESVTVRAKKDEVIEEKEKKVKVLGTSLPATGSNNLWIALAVAMLALGSLLTVGGYNLKKKGKKMNKIVGIFVGALLAQAIFATVAWAAPLSIRISEPEAVATGDFEIDYVAMDVEGQEITADCMKKGPSDGDFVKIDTKVLAAGGDSETCLVDSSVLTEGGNYDFKIIATAGSETKESKVVSVSYDGVGPSKPKYIEKDEENSCRNEVTFRTADDGQTVRVEIYRSQHTRNIVVDASSMIKSIDIGPNQKFSFDDDLKPTGCGDNYFYAIRAFDSSGNASAVREEEFEEIIEKKKIVEVVEEGPVLEAEASGIETGGEGATGEGVTTEEGAVVSEEGGTQVEGEEAGSETEVLGEQSSTFASRTIKNWKFWLAVVIIAGLAYFVWRRMKKSEEE